MFSSPVRLLLLIAALALLAPAQTATSGWRNLFDGKTLKGWRVEAHPKDAGKVFWTVEDGALTCNSLGRKDHDYYWLVSDEEFADFEITMQVRGFAESPGNSGLQFRSRYDKAASWLDGPQVDIHPPAPWRTGLIYDETREAKRWIFPSLKNWEIAPAQGPRKWHWNQAPARGGWNSIELVCRGTRVTTRVNGIVITDTDFDGILNDAAHQMRNVGLRGHFALQLHRGDELKIQYRDLRVRVH